MKPVALAYLSVQSKGLESTKTVEEFCGLILEAYGTNCPTDKEYAPYPWSEREVLFRQSLRDADEFIVLKPDFDPRQMHPLLKMEVLILHGQGSKSIEETVNLFFDRTEDVGKEVPSISISVGKVLAYPSGIDGVIDQNHYFVINVYKKTIKDCFKDCISNPYLIVCAIISVILFLSAFKLCDDSNISSLLLSFGGIFAGLVIGRVFNLVTDRKRTDFGIDEALNDEERHMNRTESLQNAYSSRVETLKPSKRQD